MTENERTKKVMMRPLRQDDAEFLCSIFKDNEEYYHIFFDSETSVPKWENRVDRYIKQDRVGHFIIEANNTAVGWLSFDIESAECEMGILVIKKEYLHHGYGAESLSWLIEKCKAENVHRVLLNVNQSNTQAIQFYKKFGFEIFAEEIIPKCNDAVNLAQYKMKLDLV